jgi:hypothetical protein
MRRIPSRRALARAKFIRDTAIQHGVHVAIIGSPHGPCAFVWAPTAPTVEQQLACEASFKRAVYRNIRAISFYAAKRGASG